MLGNPTLSEAQPDSLEPTIHAKNLRDWKLLGELYDQQRLQTEVGLPLWERIVRLKAEQPNLDTTVSQLSNYFRSLRIKYKQIVLALSSKRGACTSSKT